MNVPLRRLRPYVHRIEPVLGTRLDVTAVARSAGRADGVIDRLLSEIDRLERVFSIYDPTSELRRWSAGEVPQPSTDLQALLIAGEVWMERTGGVFSPTLGRLTQRWPLAETEGSLPTDGELAGLATTVTALPYRVRADGAVEQLGPCDALDFNALAKGLIVDAALTAAFDTGKASSLVVNVGGDLAHRRTGEVVINVENPADRAMNTAPVARARLANAASATSGTSWRGFTVGTQRFGHVIDPRTGWPTSEVGSATVIAANAATADVLATVLTVLGPDDGLAAITRFSEVEAFIVGTNGTTRQTAGWPSIAG